MYVVYDGARAKTHFFITLFFYVVYDAAKEKASSRITLFFLCCFWWSKRKNSFCYNIIFCMLSLMNQEKKLILFKHFFLYVVDDQPTENTHSVVKLFFVCCLWLIKRKNSFCYNIIFSMVCLMEQKKKLLLL